MKIYYIFLDNYSIHKTKEFNNYVNKMKNIKIIYIVPYTPRIKSH